MQRRHAAIKLQREGEVAQRHATAAQKTQNELNAASPCSLEHPYLRRKGVPALGDIRQGQNGVLLVPVRGASGNVQSLQRISPDGEKRFLTGGKTYGGHFIIQGKSEKPLAVCEGYATGASIHLACECTVYVAFSANNLPIVAGIARSQFSDKTILICGDDDEAGRSKGQEAAQAAQARLVLPSFSTGVEKDFNDLHQSEGLQEVRRQLEASANLPAALHNVPSLVSLDIREPWGIPRSCQGRYGI